MVRMVYLFKRDPEQAFWRWAEIAPIAPYALPFTPLKDLVAVDCARVSESYARSVLVWLHGECEMPEDEAANLRCPVAVLDEHGHLLAL
jgi:hypothetical protein